MSPNDELAANGSDTHVSNPTRASDPTGALGDQPSTRQRHSKESPGVADPHPADVTRDAKVPPMATTAPDATPVRERFGSGSA